MFSPNISILFFFVSKTHGWHFQSFSILMSFQLFILFILLFTPLVVTFFLQRQTSSGFHPFFGLHLFCSWVVFLSHSGCKTVKPSINVSWPSHSLYLMIPCLKKIYLYIFLCKTLLLWFKIITPKVFATLVSPCQCCSTDLTVERKIWRSMRKIWRSTAAIYLWVRHHPILSWFKQDHQWWRYHRRLLVYQNPYF